MVGTHRVVARAEVGNGDAVRTGAARLLVVAPLAHRILGLDHRQHAPPFPELASDLSLPHHDLLL